ncbi:MAG: FecR family protein [Odoribacter sp.]
MDRILKIVRLLHKYKAGKLTPEEYAELQEWLSPEKNRILAEKILSDEREKEALEELTNYDSNRAYHQFTQQISRPRIQHRWWWVAAMLLPLAIAIALFLKIDNNTIFTKDPFAQQSETPAKVEVILTLGDGQKVVLEKDRPVCIRNISGIMIHTDSSGLVYQGEVIEKEQLTYNEVYVPRRGEYTLQLSDGTRIFLNADSRLKYPETFKKDCREVELSGEGYFEVTKDPKRPFFVKVGDTKICVLGTAFNVNAYKEIPEIKTTLISGKVNIVYQDQTLELIPGEQSRFNKNDASLQKERVNVSLYTAWKDGLFKFEHENLEHIMMILERWYDIQVFFESPHLKEYLFSGDLKKYDTIEEHLKMLEMTTNIHFTIQDHSVFISNK